MSVVGPRYGATCLRPEAVNWEQALEPDERDPRILGEGPCNLIHEAKPKYEQNQFGVWLICRTCAVRLHYAPKKGAPQNKISLGPTPEVVRAVIAELANTSVSRINCNLFRGMIKTEQGRQQSAKKEAAKSEAASSAASSTVLRAKCKAPPKARPPWRTPVLYRPPEYDLSSEAQPEEDPDSPALDKWNLLLRRLFKRQLEIEAMMDL